MCVPASEASMFGKSSSTITLKVPSDFSVANAAEFFDLTMIDMGMTNISGRAARIYTLCGPSSSAGVDTRIGTWPSLKFAMTWPTCSSQKATSSKATQVKISSTKKLNAIRRGLSGTQTIICTLVSRNECGKHLCINNNEIWLQKLVGIAGLLGWNGGAEIAGMGKHDAAHSACLC